MFIRNIITSAAMVAALGLASGSAYAQDEDSHIVEGFTALANANYPGTVFVYNEDIDINEGDFTAGVVLAVLPKHLWCSDWTGGNNDVCRVPV